MENQSASERLPPFDPSLDHFARLGLERSWAIDRNALEDNYLARSRQVHPDRHANADSATRRASVEHSSALNQAYRTLRDPVERAEYLVKLGGLDLDSSDPQTGAPHPDQSFLIEMIERRERLELLQEQDGLVDLREEVEDELETVFDSAVAALAEPEFNPDRVRAAAAALVHRRYLRRFVNEIDSAIETFENG